uniref:Uncharacterized protein n=1 Tax=Setaria digitata TaxID=48799 RepID=A0A915PKF6_9BILA
MMSHGNLWKMGSFPDTVYQIEETEDEWAGKESSDSPGRGGKKDFRIVQRACMDFLEKLAGANCPSPRAVSMFFFSCE